MVVPPWYELPPPGYGGVEQVCAALVDGLVARGNQVTLFGAGTDHGTAARFVSTTPEPQQDRMGAVYPELAHLIRVERVLADEPFDVVHDHTTAGPLLAARRPVPTVATVHGKPVGEFADILTGVDPAVGLVAISHAQREVRPDLPWSGVVHNGLDIRTMPRKSKPAAGPVLWLARFVAAKGPDLAVHACRAAGLPLVLAGKCADDEERQYFDEVIRPMLGPDVTAILNPDRAACLDLLLAARCLVMPIRWEEPFGMVMIEAMATGTPVVALNRGAVPELLNHGETGFICAEPSEMAAALRDTPAIDPAACVDHVRAEFSAEVMAHRYEEVYRRRASVGRPEGVPAYASSG
ncbi:glycosyltransferase family 4 protein [Micromonospora zhanjiangensis]|uniref:Glycosyltransferase family 4 protein n=1 Tax=Micromonospora zhanjiangensis TaxID=1522057 RepID=A0ABV8KM28_9ACTN